MALLTVRNLSISISRLIPLNGISFDVDKGEILGVVGESGSGKSLTAMAIMGLLPLIGGRVTAGALHFDGVDLTKLGESEYRRLRGRRIGADYTKSHDVSRSDPARRGTDRPGLPDASRVLQGAGKNTHGIELMQRLRFPRRRRCTTNTLTSSQAA